MSRRLFLPLLFAAAILVFGVTAITAHFQSPILPGRVSGSIVLPNGWKISPAGRQLQLPGDMVMRIIPVGGGSAALISTAGFHNHSLNLIDIEKGAVVQSLDIARTFTGLAIEEESGRIFASGGGAVTKQIIGFAEKAGLDASKTEAIKSPLIQFRLRQGSLEWQDSISIPKLEDSRFISGITLGRDGSVYFADLNSDTIHKLTGPNLQNHTQARVGYRPYAIAISPDGKKLAVSNWGAESVSLLDLESLNILETVRTGSHPNELVFTKDGRLFVANSGSNSVSVVKDGKVVEEIKTTIKPNSLVGASPTALAITPDQRTLFVANSDNNSVAVIDISVAGKSGVRGFIPTDWYPSALAVTKDGKRLLIGAGKSGLNLKGNYPASTDFKRAVPDPKTAYDYIGATLQGTLSIVEIPDSQKLAAYSAQVKANFPDPETGLDKSKVELVKREVFPRIKHVLYIIRENRTYDQVFGDLGKGNGDPHLTLFGEAVTPNAHQLVRNSVILDNIYCNGEVSEDGHQWSNAAYATDFTQKAWPNSYSKRGEPEADERLTASPGGYLWDSCKAHGKSYRSYGEFASFKSTPESEPIFTGDRGLKDHSSLAWAKLKGESARDPEKADIFIAELREAEKTGVWPDYMVMSLGENHTEGLTAGRFTPIAHVASNDQALGKIVEAVSNSRFWKETAIFVIEDDAQNGPDHVDAHRTCGLVISPYTMLNGKVDSTMYSTVSMLRTMELILGLPPMTQYDELATPMFSCFTNKPDFSPYKLLPPQVDLLARNPKAGKGAEISRKMDFSDYDRADPDLLNRLLWMSVKGDEPLPAPVRSAAFTR